MKTNKTIIFGFMGIGFLLSSFSPLFAQTVTSATMSDKSTLLIQTMNSSEMNAEKGITSASLSQSEFSAFAQPPATTVKLGKCSNTYNQTPTMAQGSTDHGGQIEVGNLTNINRCEVLFSKSYFSPPFCVTTSENNNFDSRYALPPIDIVTTSTGFTIHRRGGVTLETNEQINYICIERGK